MAHSDTVEIPKEFKVGTRDKDAPWYHKDVAAGVTPRARKLLENYSKIPADQVESHVSAIRDRAWEIHPYPCIGRLSFLHLSITQSDHYDAILQLLTSTPGTVFLDLGCCFGQEIRALIAAGAPSQNTYGVDLQPEFFSLGYELFRDRDTLKTTFIQADIFNEPPELKELDGKVDVLYAGSFLHLFGWDGQVAVCERVVRFLKPQKGVMMLGRQVGDLVAGQREGGNMYRHNEESFRKMWREVGEKTGTQWRVETQMIVWAESAWQKVMEGRGASVRLLRFTVIRE